MQKRWIVAAAWLCANASGPGAGAAMAEDVTLLAAGSLKSALSQIATEFHDATGITVATDFGPSGLMRERIEAGGTAHVFASANMTHPQRLEQDGRGGPVVMFARNRLCALARPGLQVTPETLQDVMMDDAVRLGTSTPQADPSGDYAFALFDKTAHADALKAKALQLTGGPDSPAPPEGRNAYAWVLDSDQADLFLTYCTNAVLAKAELADLQIIQIPPDLSVGADYGLIVMQDAPVAAWQLAMYALSPAGQNVFKEHGFDTVALPQE
ncbi:molybdate ABC transporter substrate-binding protein [Paracoccus tegillarcae]|uniref:Molybdate ABC transporter substrate-binding protein n=1 Tax=Paracoccus tegillarcae TaxID=1529068 RepID=A0A2K9EI87_9RHOB|nr:molybdate ABC transporter substrate-binding protein [Paracoccus tegillarcae]AUH34079.1 molybdate ABC transporter substrate-binding protein [Paracoccus tegillarcae]